MPPERLLAKDQKQESIPFGFTLDNMDNWNAGHVLLSEYGCPNMLMKMLFHQQNAMCSGSWCHVVFSCSCCLSVEPSEGSTTSLDKSRRFQIIYNLELPVSAKVKERKPCSLIIPIFPIVTPAQTRTWTVSKDKVDWTSFFFLLVSFDTM